MNDLINNVVKRYESFKAGNRSATAEIDPTSVFLFSIRLAEPPYADPCHSNSFQTKESTSKAKKAAEQVSLIDFDFDEVAPVASAAPATSNPMDDLSALSSLSLGGEASSHPAPNPPPPQRVDPMSLFDLNPNSFSSAPSPTNGSSSYASPLPPAVNSSSRPSAPAAAASGGGSFFSNPAYGSSSSSSIPWGSSSPSGSQTPQGGAISLGTNSRPSSAASGLQPQPGGGAKGWGTSPPLPQLPNQQQAPVVPPKKDAFEDLLGDF